MEASSMNILTLHPWGRGLYERRLYKSSHLFTITHYGLLSTSILLPTTVRILPPSGVGVKLGTSRGRFNVEKIQTDALPSFHVAPPSASPDRQVKRFVATPPPVVVSLLHTGFVCDGRILVRHAGFYFSQIFTTSAVHVVQMSVLIMMTS